MTFQIGHFEFNDLIIPIMVDNVAFFEIQKSEAHAGNSKEEFLLS